MPSYTYRCDQCDVEYDVFHTMIESPTVKCSHCSRPMMKQFGTGGGLKFVGEGFYENDSKVKTGVPENA